METEFRELQDGSASQGDRRTNGVILVQIRRLENENQCVVSGLNLCRLRTHEYPSPKAIKRF